MKKTVSLFAIAIMMLMVSSKASCALTWYAITSPTPVPPTWSVVSNTNTKITYRLELGGFYYDIENGEVYISLDGASRHGTPGDPNTPVFFNTTMVPSTGKHSVKSTVNSYVVVDKLDELAPVPQIGYSSIDNPYDIYYKNVDRYKKDVWFPKVDLVSHPVNYSRDQALMDFGVYPIHYNPVQVKYRVATSLDIEVISDGATTPRIADHTGFEQAYCTPFHNLLIPSPALPDRLPFEYPEIAYPDDLLNNPPTACNMLIVTGPPFVDGNVPHPALESYIQYRALQSGMNVSVMAVNPAETRQTLRQRIYYFFAMYHPTYLLIIGDQTVVPSSGLWLGNADRCHWDAESGDAYYGKLVGANNSYIPEDTEALLFDYADVYVGRIGVDSGDELSTHPGISQFQAYMNKVIATEQDPDAPSYFQNFNLLNTGGGPVTDDNFNVAQAIFLPSHINGILNANTGANTSVTILNSIDAPLSHAYTRVNRRIDCSASGSPTTISEKINELFLGGGTLGPYTRAISPVTYHASHGMSGGRGWVGMYYWGQQSESYYGPIEYEQLYSPILVTASCYGGNYDQHLQDQSLMNGPYTDLFLHNDYGQNTVGEPLAGAGALIGTTRNNYSSHRGFGRFEFYPADAIRRYYKQEIWTAGQLSRIAGSNRSFGYYPDTDIIDYQKTFIFDAYYNLLGDPAFEPEHEPAAPAIISSYTELSGDLFIPGGLVVQENAELKILAGTTLTFGLNATLEVKDGGYLTIEGTEIAPVTMQGYLNNRMSWGGIVFTNDADGDDQTIDHLIVKNASKGIEVSTGSGHFYLRNIEVTDCTIGISGKNMLWVRFEDTEVYNCDYGVKAIHPEPGNGYFTLYRASVHDIEEVGIEFNDIYGGYLVTAHVYNCGSTGVKAVQVPWFNLGSTMTATDYPTKIYNCATDNSGDYALYITNTSYLNRMEDVWVFENNGLGVGTNTGVSITNNATLHDMVAIGNNNINRTAGSASEFTLGLDCSFDIANHNYNIFNDSFTWTSILPVLLVHASANDMDADDTWWGPDAADASDVLSHVVYMGSGTLNVGPIATEPHGGANWYPGIATLEDSPEHMLTMAYTCLDTTDGLGDGGNGGDSDGGNGGGIEQAIQLFSQLIEEGYSPAIRGLATALLLRGDSPATIDSQISDIIELADNNHVTTSRFISGDILVHHGEFSAAIETFQNIAEEATEELTVISAQLSALETERLSLIVEDGNGKRGSSNEYRISEIDQKIADLNEKMLGFDTESLSGETLPSEYSLQPAYPNPFNPTVTIPFTLPENGKVKIAIYNVLGKEVATLVNGNRQAGLHNVVWDGQNNFGAKVGSGIYFVRMEASEFATTSKIVMMK